jgi:glutathione S-transferase
MKLYTFHQSGSAYRVRIALNLKRIGYESVLVRGGRGRIFAPPTICG